MIRRDAVWSVACVATLGLALVSGCEKSAKVHYLGKADLTHYRKEATRIDYPQVCTKPNEDAFVTEEPRRLGLARKDDVWDMPLFEAVRLALQNNPIIRNRAQFLRTGTAPLSDSTTVFDPALVETETLFGQQGVEGALSEFDAMLTTSMIWGRDERIQNNPFISGGIAPGNTLVEETGVFNSRLEKTFATGGRVAVNHNWNYEWNNQPARLFPSTYIGQLEAEYRQPLWGGAGTEFTRIAGPVLRRDPFRSVQSLDQGVVIARIRNDMSLADFQAAVRNLLKDTEDLYWELYLSYQVYNGEVAARNAALETWRTTKARPDVGAAEEAQARDFFFEARARAEQALADIYEREGALRRLVGLPVNDGRVIRPCDDPVTAEYCADWHMSLAEALTRRAEIRRQKWMIKSFELQCEAAKSLTKPRLDFVSKYRVNAFGDDLFGENDDDGVTRQGLNSAYETLTEGDQTGWNLGLEFTMPFGFRAARTQQRNIELKLAKARTQLAAQELEISHEVSNAFQGLGRWHQVMQTNFNRLAATEDRVKAYEALRDANNLQTIDLLLRAQTSRAAANNEYYRSVVEYNKAIANLHYRKETLLEHDGVRLAEGGWDKRAYEEALRRGWARSYACQDPGLLGTEPCEFAKPNPPADLLPNVIPAGHAEGSIVPGELAPPPAPSNSNSNPNPVDAEPPKPPSTKDYDTKVEAPAKEERGTKNEE